MSAVVQLRPAAHQDAVDHYLYIQADNADAAERFLDALDHAYDLLAHHPHSGHLYFTNEPPLTHLRVLRLPSPFRNYAVYHFPSPQTIDVVRVLHGAMNITPEFFVPP